MNELTAPVFAKKDANHDLPRFEKAKGPAEILVRIRQRILFRLSDLYDDRARELVKPQLADLSRSAETLSAAMGLTAVGVINILRRQVPIEDTYAFALWMAGTEETPGGYILELIDNVQDSEVELSKECVLEAARGILASKAEASKDVADHIKELKRQGGHQKARVLLGLGLEERQAMVDKDGTRVHILRIQQNKLSRRIRVHTQQALRHA